MKPGIMNALMVADMGRLISRNRKQLIETVGADASVTGVWSRIHATWLMLVRDMCIVHNYAQRGRKTAKDTQSRQEYLELERQTAALLQEFQAFSAGAMHEVGHCEQLMLPDAVVVLLDQQHEEMWSAWGRVPHFSEVADCSCSASNRCVELEPTDDDEADTGA